MANYHPPLAVSHGLDSCMGSMRRRGHYRHCRHWRWRQLLWSLFSSRVVASMIVISSSLVGVDALPWSPLSLSSLVVVVSKVLVLVAGSGILDHRHRWKVVPVATAIVAIVASGCLP